MRQLQKSISSTGTTSLQELKRQKCEKRVTPWWPLFGIYQFPSNSLARLERRNMPPLLDTTTTSQPTCTNMAGQARSIFAASPMAKAFTKPLLDTNIT